jgi:predicted metal-binding membrane protein
MWMRMSGQSSSVSAKFFVGTCVLMTAAMKLPSLTPVLWRYRRAVAAIAPGRTARLMALVATGYFALWTAVGIAAFPIGAAAAGLAMRHPSLAGAVPALGALAVLLAGAMQFTAAKARHLACCRDVALETGVPHLDGWSAWQAGVRHGVRCVRACAGPTAVLFALGVMDPAVMALVTVAITLERLVPATVRTIGAACVVAGLVLLGRAVGLA